jgi:hypothetical protein
LISSDFVVRLKYFVLDFDFLDVEVRLNVDILNLELKREASLNEVSGVEDLNDVRVFLKINKVSALGS